mmetsp:Transcript_8049/g.17468  ORF Transcript_8049/g.17468 Transcript_8049/m.17468 type:complete len:926 (-) Transcript_8049:48-2825(-)
MGPQRMEQRALAKLVHGLQHLDTDSDGTVSRELVEQVLESIDATTFEKQSLSYLFESAGCVGDRGRIDYQSFATWLSTCPSQSAELKVWLGFIKLDGRFPTCHALQKLLYDSPTSSAEDADVIAMCFHDLMVTEDNLEDMRHLLYKSLRRPEEYIVNEDDKELSVRHIPAQLVRVTDEGERFVSMSVAVHRRNVRESQKDSRNNYDCFPTPVYIACRSPRKNEAGPGGKFILAQDLVLYRNGAVLDLILLGANLDTDDQSKEAQLEAVERLLRARMKARPFCALLWGDLNNRLVAFEELRPHVTQSKGKWKLLDSGLDLLISMIEDPERRRELLQKDALLYKGKDVLGREFRTSRCNDLLRSLFSLHIDAVQQDRVPVPLPSYKRTPADYMMSLATGCSLRFQEMVYTDEINSTLISMYRSAKDVREAYFGWMRAGKPVQQVFKADACDSGEHENLYLQLGWPDGVGVYRLGTVEAEVRNWKTEPNVRAYDHLPMISTVSLKIADCELRVWLGSVKLDGRLLTHQALQDLLYAHPDTSADDADVIAIFLIDLKLTEYTTDDVRHLLQKALRNGDEYILNETDVELPIRHIPAQLVRVTAEGSSFASMSVAVHKRNVHDDDQDGDLDNHDCFPTSVSITCRSGRKNLSTPGAKFILAQDVVLSRNGVVLDLVLLGANLDSDDQSKESQLEAAHRLLKARKRERPFCALIWGALNNRLVAFEELRPHVTELNGKWQLQTSGIDLLTAMIADPERRRELIQKDVLLFQGRDVRGREFKTSRCYDLLRTLFSLHLDAVQEAGLPVPLPSYMRSPMDYVMSQALGCAVQLQDVFSIKEMRSGSWLHRVVMDLRRAYFGWHPNGKAVQQKLKADTPDNGAHVNLFLQMGWLDGVGVYNGSTVRAELWAWETDDSLSAFDHLPLRSVVGVYL